MIKSMTGFGRGRSKEGEQHSFTIEMKSVNSRYLDLNIRMPKFMLSLEDKIRKQIGKSLSRGKVDVFITYNNYGKNDVSAKLNESLAESYMKCLEKIATSYDVKNDISVSLIAKFPDVITVEEEEENLDYIWKEVSTVLNEALEMMLEMRIKEGESLKKDINIKVDSIEKIVNQINDLSENVVEDYKNKLEDRIKELLPKVDIDENRIAQEVAIFADKAAIDEEITRLHSHILQIRSNLELSEPIGRKLDFIIQEVNRETNTIASKSSSIEITNKVIDIKNIIEKIREQVQNIE